MQAKEKSLLAANRTRIHECRLRGLRRAIHDASALDKTICDECPLALSEGCREDASLRDLIGNWHQRTPSVRAAIMNLARAAQVSGRRLDANGMEPVLIREGRLKGRVWSALSGFRRLVGRSVTRKSWNFLAE